jgi:hypothetical protein
VKAIHSVPTFCAKELQALVDANHFQKRFEKLQAAKFSCIVHQVHACVFVSHKKYLTRDSSKIINLQKIIISALNFSKQVFKQTFSVSLLKL